MEFAQRLIGAELINIIVTQRNKNVYCFEPDSSNKNLILFAVPYLPGSY